MAQKFPPRKASDGATIDGTFGAHGNDPREHRNAREDEARSPTRRRRTKTAQNGGLRAEVAASRRRFFLSAQERDRGEKRGKMGRGRRRAALCPLLIQARGGENVGADFDLAVQQRERKSSGGLGKGMNLSGGPHLSAAIEGEGERREPASRLAGPRPRKGARGGGGGFGPKGRI